jgi:hypothetical protein
MRPPALAEQSKDVRETPHPWMGLMVCHRKGAGIKETKWILIRSRSPGQIQDMASHPNHPVVLGTRRRMELIHLKVETVIRSQVDSSTHKTSQCRMSMPGLQLLPRMETTQDMLLVTLIPLLACRKVITCLLLLVLASNQSWHPADRTLSNIHLRYLGSHRSHQAVIPVSKETTEIQGLTLATQDIQASRTTMIQGMRIQARLPLSPLWLLGIVSPYQVHHSQGSLLTDGSSTLDHC